MIVDVIHLTRLTITASKTDRISESRELGIGGVVCGWAASMCISKMKFSVEGQAVGGGRYLQVKTSIAEQF